MFRQEKTWRDGVVRQEGRTTRVSVPPRKDTWDKGFSVFLFIAMSYGVGVVAFSNSVNLAPIGVLLRVFFSLVFELINLWTFLDLWERDFAERIVIVSPTGVVWLVKMTWWTRRRELKDIQDIISRPAWGGFGLVVVRTPTQERIVFSQITCEEADRLAHELRHALKQ